MRLLALLLLALPAFAQSPCDRSADASCETPMGSYRAALPASPPPDGGYPALVFFHGAGSSGRGTLSMSAMVNTFTANGWAVIAPDGLQREFGNRRGGGWSFRPDGPQRRDEMAFTKEVIADAASRLNANPERVLVGGFSIGGSLAWYLACQDPTIATGFVPVAGAFWRPHPETADCAGPIEMLHTHGWQDRTVPLEGRPLRGGQIIQGDVFHALSVIRELNGCTMLRADEFATEGRYWRRMWTDCTSGAGLDLALHPGGHSVPRGWAEMVLGWVETNT